MQTSGTDISPVQQRAVVVAFARLPVPGQVKTRLAAGIGPEPAAAFYKLCAEHACLEVLRYTPLTVARLGITPLQIHQLMPALLPSACFQFESNAICQVLQACSHNCQQSMFGRHMCSEQVIQPGTGGTHLSTSQTPATAGSHMIARPHGPHPSIAA